MMYTIKRDLAVLAITCINVVGITYAATGDTFPVMNSKQYLYRAGNILPNIEKPITGYYSSTNSNKSCVDVVDGKSDGCVPKYAFYALANPYAKDPSYVSSSTESNWYREKNIPSLSFWGSAGDLYPQCFDVNGKTTGEPKLAPELGTAWSKTRVKYVNKKSFRWAPKTPTDIVCPTTKASGASYAIYTKGTSTPGVGLFTMSGKSFHNEFWRAHPSNGVNGTGNNANISGTFFNFFQQPDYYNPIKPFSGNSNDYTVKRMILESTQSVYNVSTYGDTTTIAQVQQKADVVLGNKACLDERKNSPSLVCQINYIQHAYINRREYKDGKAIPTESFSWNQHARYNFDPQQGGMPYLSGPLKGNGEVTQLSYGGRKYTLWTSRGASTQFQSDTFPRTDPATGLAVTSFENLTFRTEMTFNQYLTFLKILGADYLSQQTSKTFYPEDISDQYMASKFGSKWNDPNEWIVMRIGFAQEAMNPNQETESVTLGGNIKMINVQALP